MAILFQRVPSGDRAAIVTREAEDLAKYGSDYYFSPGTFIL